MANTSPSMISTFRDMPNLSRSCAASTRSSSTAINRRTRRASREVRMPRPGPISSTVVCDTSPSASTMRTAPSSLLRKCCPNLGLDCGRRAEATFGTLTLTSPGSRLASRYSHLSAGPRSPSCFHHIVRHKKRARRGRFRLMNIAFAASEGVPFSKTGGLADVVGALPRALAALGHQVTVYLPRYRQTKLTDPAIVVRSVTVPFDDQYRFASVVSGGTQGGVRFYFVEYPPYFDRDALYGTPAGDYPDNAERFALFSRTVLEASKILGVPHIFHCHDWQSALIPVLLRTIYADDPAFKDTGTVFTIHNMGYQGLFPPETLPLLMLPWDLFTMSKMEFFGQVNFLKGALTYSDYITTVSKKYSHEIQTTEYGFGLEGVLRDRAATVTGILNGVDYEEWSPQTDKFTTAKYSPQDLAGKAKDRQDLLAAFGVVNADPKLPVIGIVSRFAAQKGFEIGRA